MSLAICLMLLSLQACTIVNVYTSESHRPANEVKVKSTGVVAFSVGRTTRFAPRSLSRVPMDHVFYNKGGYFNMKTSIFTAPVSGVYAFYFGGGGARWSGVNIRLHAGNPEKPIAATYNENSNYGHASGFVIIEMKKRGQASMWLDGRNVLKGYKPPSTHFSGYLVSATGD